MIDLQSSSPADEHERQVQIQLHALEPWLLAEYGDRNCGSDHVRAVLTTPHDRRLGPDPPVNPDRTRRMDRTDELRLPAELNPDAARRDESGRS